MTPDERHLEAIGRLGCIMARLGWEAECMGRVERHHLREGQGAAQRADDFLTVPLCHNHHQSTLGIHHRKSFRGRTGLDELDLLAATLRALEITWPKEGL